MKKYLLIIFILLVTNLQSQDKLVADPNATKSIDGIVKELLELISGEKGKVRDWEVLRSLFLPTAHFTSLTHDEKSDQPVETVSLDEFIALLHDTYYDQGFWEYEVHKVVDEYNGIAQVFQTYHAKDAEALEERGITSYQLVYYADRWWIANVVWTGDSNGVAIPKKYLKK